MVDRDELRHARWLVKHGKTGIRALADAHLATWAARFTGTALDVGSGPEIDVGNGAEPRYAKTLPDISKWIGVDPVHSYSIVGDAHALPVASCAVDVVTMMWVLHNLADPSTALAETSRVLRPGGRVVFTAMFAYQQTLEPLDHWRFAPDGIRRLLDVAGFEDAEIHPIGDRALVTVEAWQPLLAKTGLYKLGVRAAFWADPKIMSRTRMLPTAFLVTATKRKDDR